MKKLILTSVAMLTIVLFAPNTQFSSSAKAKAKCNVVGLNWKGSHPTLKQGLCDMSRALGTITIANTKKHQNCRTKADKKGKPNSWHKYHRGCRAADIRIKGVSPNRIKKWWLNYTNKKPYLGGASVYGSGFVHVDTRTEGARSW